MQLWKIEPKIYKKNFHTNFCFESTTEGHVEIYLVVFKRMIFLQRALYAQNYYSANTLI